MTWLCDRAAGCSRAPWANRCFLGPLLALGLLASSPISAHHGAALYDSSQIVTVRGAVTQFKFVFPHTLVYISVEDADGNAVEWSGELTTPNRLARGIAGGATPTPIKWTANTLLPGDVIELTGNPARNGAPSMRIQRLVDATGRALIGDTGIEMTKASAPVEPLASGNGADFRGVWMRRYEHRWENYAFSEQLPAMTPWAQARFDVSKPTFGPRSVAVAETNDPIYECLPPGLPRIYAHPAPFEVFQFPDRVVIVYEFQHHVRQIYTDGRGHDEGRPVGWMGDAIGRWEGETLVVETTKFNDMTWVDRRGVPHSDQLRVLERFSRDGDELAVEITVEDPIAFDAPWTARRVFDRVDWTLAENVCVDSEYFEEFESFERETIDFQGNQ
jgi:hypothetical protein